MAASGSSFQYNSITLNEPLVVDMLEYGPLFDGPTYLCTRVTLAVQGYYNPATTAYSLQGGKGPPVVGAGLNGPAGPTTDMAVRHQLAQPRQNLSYTVGGSKPVKIFDIKGPDAQNGPIPLTVPHVEMWGGKTYKVRITIQFHLQEANLYVTTPSVLLSHRWRMSHHLDADAFCTRRIVGHAIFRSDRLKTLKANPDDYRSFTFHPPLLNFRRLPIDVEVDEDNLTLSYQITDVEQAINVIAGQGVSRIEAWHSASISRIGWEGRLAGGASAGWNIVKSIGSAVGLGEKNKVLDIGGVVDSVGAGARTAAGFVPTNVHALGVRVFGQKQSTRANLEACGVGILGSRMSFISLRPGVAQASVMHDLMGKFVDCSLTYRLGLTQNVWAAGAFGGIPPASVPDPMMPKSETVTGTFTDQPAMNPLPPNDPVAGGGGSRGQYLGDCVAQALQAPNAIPTAPTNPPNVTARKPP